MFECLSGVRQQGISGAVLADGMGLGKQQQQGMQQLGLLRMLPLACLCMLSQHV